MNKILWVSVVNIYKVDDLGALECFCYISQGKKKKKEREWELSWLKGFYSMYIDVYLIDNLIYFIGSPTCISHTLQVGSCLAQGESSHKHREEHPWEMESSIAINDYRVTSAHMCSRKTSPPVLGYSSHLTNRVQDNQTHYIKS